MLLISLCGGCTIVNFQTSTWWHDLYGLLTFYPFSCQWATSGPGNLLTHLGCQWKSVEVSDVHNNSILYISKLFTDLGVEEDGVLSLKVVVIQI